MGKTGKKFKKAVVMGLACCRGREEGLPLLSVCPCVWRRVMTEGSRGEKGFQEGAMPEKTLKDL